jgi:short-subunit dehydrogenase
LQAENDPKAYYAVIYGSNKAGRAFAFYLAERGFNMILIDQDPKKLEELGADLASKYPRQQIEMIQLTRYDNEYLKQALRFDIRLSENKTITKPIKLFINCFNQHRVSKVNRLQFNA